MEISGKKIAMADEKRTSKSYVIVGLRELRVGLGISKSELGRLAKVSARTIANAEKEDSGLRPETANRIVSALKKAADDNGKGDGKKIEEPEVKQVEKPKSKKKKKRKDEI